MPSCDYFLHLRKLELELCSLEGKVDSRERCTNWSLTSTVLHAKIGSSKLKAFLRKKGEDPSNRYTEMHWRKVSRWSALWKKVRSRALGSQWEGWNVYEPEITFLSSTRVISAIRSRAGAQWKFWLRFRWASHCLSIFRGQSNAFSFKKYEARGEQLYLLLAWSQVHEVQRVNRSITSKSIKYLVLR